MMAVVAGVINVLDLVVVQNLVIVLDHAIGHVLLCDVRGLLDVLIDAALQ